MTFGTNLRLPALMLVVTLLFAGCTGAQEAATDAPPEPEQETNDTPFTPYSEVITDAAESDEGLFTSHRIDDNLYYEIPDSLLGKEMLLVTRIAQTADNIGYGGEKANEQVVRWERQFDKVLLRVAQYSNVADPDTPIYQAVRNSNFEPIIMSFDIEALSEDEEGVVIDVTSLYTSDVPALGLQQGRRSAYGVRRLDASRTYLESVRSFPENIEVRHLLTYEAQNPPSNSSTNAISLMMNQSMVLLPAEPMQRRLADERVGFFSIQQVDFGRDTQRAEERTYISRWRLEPSDMEAFERGELVEPVKPIVYYIDPATPEQWRPYLKQGVEDWNVAFEAAGFKNAIMAKDPPTAEEDPEFSPEDIRYSTIRYFASQTQNAYGPRTVDPRTGEILGSDIGWYHNVMNLLRDWYFVQTAAANPEARGVEFEEEVMGELIRFVSAHEVGHTIGLPHNWGSAVATPVDSLRSPTYTANNGTAASIMDYARFNYVAQPEDGVTDFMAKLGPYDLWSVEFGYRPIPEASTPDEERPIINEWIKARADDPRYFYGRQTGNPIDPRSQREALGDDTIEASRLGVENLKRILPNIIEWTYREGENFDQAGGIFNRLIGQWDLYMGHVGRYVGGVYENHKTYDQDGVVYEVVDAQYQRDAMAFLQAQAFETPTWMLEEDLVQRLEHGGFIERIRTRQARVLNLLMEPQRLARLIEAEARLGTDAYSAPAMLADLREGIWHELSRAEAVDPFRRNLQRTHIDRLGNLMTAEVSAPPAQFRAFLGFTPVNVAQSDIRAFVRGELMTLRSDIERAERRANDRTTQLHLQDALVRINDILDGDA